jgi:hypothetical protein
MSTANRTKTRRQKRTTIPDARQRGFYSTEAARQPSTMLPLLPAEARGSGVLQRITSQLTASAQKRTASGRP